MCYKTGNEYKLAINLIHCLSSLSLLSFLPTMIISNYDSPTMILNYDSTHFTRYKYGLESWLRMSFIAHQQSLLANDVFDSDASNEWMQLSDTKTLTTI